jgi:hypothetical protein
LLASAKAFSAFFALAIVDLCDFSAFALAVVATSKAHREALSSASSDAMRALADAKASAVQQRKERISQAKRKEKHTRQAKIGQRIHLRKLLQPSSTQYIQCPRRRISSSMPDKGGTRKYMEGARKISTVQSLTLSGESVGSCASRETLASWDFFDRLVLRDAVIFLVEALVALGACTAGLVSCTGGSSVITS